MVDYLVLYVILDTTDDALLKIYPVSIKHHKQLPFDFRRLWL